LNLTTKQQTKFKSNKYEKSIIRSKHIIIALKLYGIAKISFLCADVISAIVNISAVQVSLVIFGRYVPSFWTAIFD